MLEIRISLDRAGIDNPVELERLHSSLLYELEDLDVGSVAPFRADELEPGARGAGAILLGVVKVWIPEPAVTVLEPLLDTLSEYSKRTRQPLKVEVNGNKIEIPDATPEERAVALRVWAAASLPDGRER